MTKPEDALTQDVLTPLNQSVECKGVPLFSDRQDAVRTPDMIIPTFLGQFNTSVGTLPSTWKNVTFVSYFALCSVVLWATSFNIQAPKSFKLSSVSAGDIKLRFANPIEVLTSFRGSMFVMENRELGIMSMESKYQDCLNDFMEEVVFIYEEYGLANDDELTGDARQLKQKILTLYGSDKH